MISLKTGICSEKESVPFRRQQRYSGSLCRQTTPPKCLRGFGKCNHRWSKSWKKNRKVFHVFIATQNQQNIFGTLPCSYFLMVRGVVRAPFDGSPVAFTKNGSSPSTFPSSTVSLNCRADAISSLTISCRLSSFRFDEPDMEASQCLFTKQHQRRDS